MEKEGIVHEAEARWELRHEKGRKYGETSKYRKWKIVYEINYKYRKKYTQITK